MKIKLNEQLVISQSEDNCIIYSTNEDQIFKLNSTAGFVVRFLSDNKMSTSEELLKSAQEHFNNFDDKAMSAFIKKLLKLEILIEL